MVEELIKKFISQFDSSPFLSVILIIILVVYALGWLLPKSKEVTAWKELFSKNKVEELKKAREELRDVPEEAAFYDEALREDLFHTVTRIRCRKKYRRIYQKLVTDGITSVEGIRHAFIHIYENKSRIEIQFSCIEKIMAALLTVGGLFGIAGIFISLNDIASLFDVSKYPNTLFILSGGVLCVSLSLQMLLPMVFALGIRKRLKKRDQEEAHSSPPPAEELSPSVQETEETEQCDPSPLIK